MGNTHRLKIAYIGTPFIAEKYNNVGACLAYTLDTENTFGDTGQQNPDMKDNCVKVVIGGFAPFISVIALIILDSYSNYNYAC